MSKYTHPTPTHPLHCPHCLVRVGPPVELSIHLRFECPVIRPPEKR